MAYCYLNNFDLNLVEKKFHSKGTMNEFTIKYLTHIFFK